MPSAGEKDLLPSGGICRDSKTIGSVIAPGGGVVVGVGVAVELLIAVGVLVGVAVAELAGVAVLVRVADAVAELAGVAVFVGVADVIAVAVGDEEVEEVVKTTSTQ